MVDTQQESWNKTIEGHEWLDIVYQMSCDDMFCMERGTRLK